MMKISHREVTCTIWHSWWEKTARNQIQALTLQLVSNTCHCSPYMSMFTGREKIPCRYRQLFLHYVLYSRHQALEMKEVKKKKKIWLWAEGDGFLFVCLFVFSRCRVGWKERSNQFQYDELIMFRLPGPCLLGEHNSKDNYLRWQYTLWSTKLFKF